MGDGVKLLLADKHKSFLEVVVSLWVYVARQTQSTKKQPVYNIFIISQGKHEG